MNKHFVLAAMVLVFCLLGVILAISPEHGPASARPLDSVPEPQWGIDIQVNPPPSRTPVVDRNYSLAVNPLSPNNVIAGYESPFSGEGIVSYAWSTNGGRTWGGNAIPGPWGGDLTPIQDAHVAFDANGIGYYSV